MDIALALALAVSLPSHVFKMSNSHSEPRARYEARMQLRMVARK